MLRPDGYIQSRSQDDTGRLEAAALRAPLDRRTNLCLDFSDNACSQFDGNITRPISSDSCSLRLYAFCSSAFEIGPSIASQSQLPTTNPRCVDPPPAYSMSAPLSHSSNNPRNLRYVSVPYYRGLILSIALLQLLKNQRTSSRFSREGEERHVLTFTSELRRFGLLANPRGERRQHRIARQLLGGY